MLDHVTKFSKLIGMTNEEKIQKIKAIAAELREEYEYVGIRTTEIEMDVNDLDYRSKIWIDGDMTDEELDGISTTDLDNDRHWVGPHLLKEVGLSGYYAGTHTYIIAGNQASYGEDIAEVIITPEKIIKI